MMPFQAMRLRSVQAYAGPLDAYTANLWSALSLKRLFASYLGPCFTGVNTTTSASADIGFNSDGTLNTTALTSLSGANNVAVQTFMSQIGASGRNFDDGGNSARRPAIVTSGSYLGSVQFDGSTDGFASGASSGAPSAFTVFMRGKLRGTSGTQIILEHSGNYNSNDAAVAYYDAGSMSVGSHKVSPSGYARSDFSGAFPNDNVQCWRLDRSQSAGAAQSVLFINGTKQTRSGNGDVVTIPSGNFGSFNWYMGARNLGSLFAQLNVHTLLIYEGALSDADVSAISTIVAGL